VVRLPVRRNRLLMELLATSVFVLGIGALLLPLVQSDGGSGLLGPRLPRAYAAAPPSRAEEGQEESAAHPADVQQEAASTMGLAALSQPPTGAPPVAGESGSAVSGEAIGTSTSPRSSTRPSPRSSSVSSTAAAASVAAGAQAETTALLSTVAIGEKLAAVDTLGDEARGIYLEGLRHLRAGLSDGSRSSVAAALESFSLVVQLAPKFAAGHFHQGVCLYRVQNYSDAQTAFIEAVKLDDDLWEHCPLLYYEDCGSDWPLVPTRFLSGEDAVQMQHFVRLQPERQSGEMAIDPTSQLLSVRRSVSDIHVEARVRFRGTNGDVALPYMALKARMHTSGARGSVYLQAALWGDGLVDFRLVTHPEGAYEKTVLDSTHVELLRDRWYRLSLDVVGGEYVVSIDGVPILHNTGASDPALTMAGRAVVGVRTTAGNTLDLDDILMIRSHSR